MATTLPYETQEEINVNSATATSALDYGVKGASAGAAFGPWGAAIGFGLGAIGGGIYGNIDAESQNRTIGKQNLESAKGYYEEQGEKNQSKLRGRSPFNPVNTFSSSAQKNINNVMDPTVAPYASTAVSARKDQLSALGLGTTGDLTNYR